MRAPVRTLTKQPFAAHVAELRGRLFATFTVLLAGAGVGYLLRQTLLNLLIAPLHQPLYYTSPGGGFNFVLQLYLVFGAVCAIPVLILHTLRFVSPILPPHTNRFIAGSLLASCALMGLGIAFAYLVSLPAALHFLNEFSTSQVSALISTDTYLSFVTTYLAAFALLFQLPLVLLIANKLTPLPPKTLLKQTRWVLLISFIFSAIVTPTQDPINQTIMAGPIIILFLASTGLIPNCDGEQRYTVGARRSGRMPRHLTLTPYLTTAELLSRYRHSADPVARRHDQILWLRSTGQHCPQVAAASGYSAEWIRTLVRRYNDDGPDAVADGRHANPGHAPLLDAAGMAALQQALTGPAPDGGVWSGPKVAAWMAARLNRPVSNYRGWAVLRRAGDTRQVPRPQATTADPAAQQAFKKGDSPKRWMRSAPPTRMP